MPMNKESRNKFISVARELQNKAQELSNYYIFNSDVRIEFLNEEDDFIRSIEKEVNQFCLSYSGAIALINEEIDYLNRQKYGLDMNKVQLYLIAEREKEKNSFVTITLKRVGFVGGGMQIYGGGSVCAASLGLACAGYGIPLMSHGINNMYENGYYLLFREDVTGYTKDAYRYIANKIGYNNDDADIIYNLTDIGLSGYGLGRQVLKPDAWKLYRYINTDYTRGWKLMGGTERVMEGVVNAGTGYGIYQIKEKQ